MHTSENFPMGDDDSTDDCANELSLFELGEAIERIEDGD